MYFDGKNWYMSAQASYEAHCARLEEAAARKEKHRRARAEASAVKKAMQEVEDGVGLYRCKIPEGTHFRFRVEAA